MSYTVAVAVPPGYGPSAEAERMRRAIDRFEHLAGAAGLFLGEAFPAVPAETIAQLTQAYADFLAGETREYLELLEAAPRVDPKEYKARHLTELGSRRDRVARQIDQMMGTVEKLPLELKGLADMIEGMFVAQKRDELASLDEQIEALQSDLMGGPPANLPFLEEFPG